jgi:hypothetical protein
MSLTTIVATAHLVTTDAEGKSRKRRHEDGEGKYSVLGMNTYVLFTELIFNGGSLFRNYTWVSEFDFNYLLQLARLFQNKLPIIVTAFKQILDWL